MIDCILSTIENEEQRNELQVFYMENYKRFIYIAMQKVNDEEIAADVIQEVFLDIANKPEIFFKATPHNQLHRTPKSGKIKT